MFYCFAVLIHLSQLAATLLSISFMQNGDCKRECLSSFSHDQQIVRSHTRLLDSQHATPKCPVNGFSMDFLSEPKVLYLWHMDTAMPMQQEPVHW